LLRYNVDAQVGGKIAQLGARLIDATAKKMADQFFVRFASEVEQSNSDPGKPTDEAVQAASTELPVSGATDFSPSSIQAAPAPVAAGPRDYPNMLALSAMVAVVGIVAIVAMLTYALAR
jgi:hypothetical protein